MLVAALFGLAAAAPVTLSQNAAKQASPLVNAVEAPGLLSHLETLEGIAAEFSNSRALLFGFNASVDYVASMLQANTDWVVSKQSFPTPVYTHISSAVQIAAPFALELTYLQDFSTLQYGGDRPISISVPTLVRYVPNEGCTAEDYSVLLPGEIAAVDTGSLCDQWTRASLAEKAGASAVFVLNLAGTTGFPSGRVRPNVWLPGDTIVQIPVIGFTYTLAQLFKTQAIPVLVTLSVVHEVVVTGTMNLCADSPTGNSDSVILVGAHLDSVPAGPGINDNGTGSSIILEIALLINSLALTYANKLRFCWWTGEEIGLVGSRYYAQNLTPEEKARIRLNLSYDMVGSPNYVTMIYDGTTAPEDVRNVSTLITVQYENYFQENGIPYRMRAMDGRSDYASFNEVGIAAGGLSTGSNFIKTEDERRIYGGIANAQMDPSYHLAADTVENIDVPEFTIMAKNTAAAIEYWADFTF
eukprot:TRINITY_DN11521_c0_g1_i1.p1 TRINITY_DN11521_c0_g1~~TRINITY_DN11521_c0_g1_i1.p1  ORF type:complete len:477 (+),score=108.76 TRINITY_DN11521_c0_g1_i1:24-1433(+)